MTPSVVRIRRKSGQVVQDCDVYIGRSWHMGGWSLNQSKWHNPYKLSQFPTREACLQAYEKHIRSRKDLLEALSELKGKKLGCFCHPQPCHGDILVKLFREFNEIP
ncbi:MAG: DUF4326 domain-containing protein [Sulfobacillus sp.]